MKKQRKMAMSEALAICADLDPLGEAIGLEMIEHEDGSWEVVPIFAASCGKGSQVKGGTAGFRGGTFRSQKAPPKASERH